MRGAGVGLDVDARILRKCCDGTFEIFDLFLVGESGNWLPAGLLSGSVCHCWAAGQLGSWEASRNCDGHDDAVFWLSLLARVQFRRCNLEILYFPTD